MAVYNRITGRKRRLPPKYTSRKKRAGSLDTKAVDLLKGINEEKKSWVTISMVAVNVYISAYFALQTIVIPAGNQPLQASLIGCMTTIYNGIILPATVFYSSYRTLNEAIGDISITEENEPVFRRNPLYRRISGFMSDDEAKAFTNFTKAELRTLLRHFDIPPTVHSHTYHLHHEEVLVYGLIKLKGGFQYAKMLDAVLHDEECRISHAVKYFLQHVDNKYYNLIGPRGLERWGASLS
jgi:hypothetical protein